MGESPFLTSKVISGNREHISCEHLRVPTAIVTPGQCNQMCCSQKNRLRWSYTWEYMRINECIPPLLLTIQNLPVGQNWWGIFHSPLCYWSLLYSLFPSFLKFNLLLLKLQLTMAENGVYVLNCVTEIISLSSENTEDLQEADWSELFLGWFNRRSLSSPEHRHLWSNR